MKQIDDRLVELFKRKFVEAGPNECWEWLASKNSWGYGIMCQNRKQVQTQWLAHRISYEHFVGPIPEGMLVCHTCDNPGCVNPSHLFLGSNADNIADRQAKGRGVVGERGGNSKLTEAQAREIIARYRAGESPRTLGPEYGITHNSAWHIITGRTWPHLKDENSKTSTGWNTPLTEADALEIIALRHQGQSRKEIAAKFSINANSVSRICSGARWGHLQRTAQKGLPLE